MNVRTKRIGCAVMVTILIGMVVFLTLGYVQDSRLRKEGDLIVQKVEGFRAIQGRLPESLSEIGVEYSELNYDKRDKESYVVWYGRRLGESTYYDSRKRVWDLGG